MQKIIWVSLALLFPVFFFLNHSEQDQNSFPEGAYRILVPSSCTLSSSPCSIDISDTLSFDIASSPGEIKALEPVKVRIRYSEGLQSRLENIALRFEGKEMDMGRHMLLPQQDSLTYVKNNLFEGMIPVCSVDPMMAWNLVVDLMIDGQYYSVSLALTTAH